MKKYLWMLFLVIAAIFNAIMDTLDEGHFTRSVFRNWDVEFWHKRVSWQYATRIFNYPIDGWHLMKSGMIICIVLAVVTYTSSWFKWGDKVRFNLLKDFVVGCIIWVSIFNIFYNYILM